MWTRLVSSGKYQLIYDADRIPAFNVLEKYCDEKLTFLCPPAKNLNYNFQYNSLRDINVALTPREHLEVLKEKYLSAETGKGLFDRIMSVQDNSDRVLFSVNRFIYTSEYEYIFDKFEHTVEHARESLQLFHEWLSDGPYEPVFAMVIRDLPDWIKAMSSMRISREKISKFVNGLSPVLDACLELKIPVFVMKDVISVMNAGELDFEKKAIPLPEDSIREVILSSKDALRGFSTRKTGQQLLRLDRLKQFLSEKDPIKRSSLVRSIGKIPLKSAYMFPSFKISKRIIESFEAVALDNSRITPL